MKKRLLTLLVLLGLTCSMVFSGCKKTSEGKEQEEATTEMEVVPYTEEALLPDEPETEKIVLDKEQETEIPVESIEKQDTESENPEQEENAEQENTETSKEMNNERTDQKEDTSEEKQEVSEEQTEQETEFDMPDLIGMSQDEALKIIGEKNLVLNDVGYEYSDTVANGYVMNQSITAGNKIKEGYNIEIVLSKGPEATTVPDVIGMKASQAKELLEAKGFHVKCSIGDDMEVSYQSYAAGDSIKEGTVISIK